MAISGPRTRGGGTCWRTGRPAATPATSTWTGTARGACRNIVLLPILGDHYGRVLEAGELQLERDGGVIEPALSRTACCRCRPRSTYQSCSLRRGEPEPLGGAGLPRRRARALPRSTVTDEASIAATAPRQGGAARAARAAARGPDGRREPSTPRSAATMRRSGALDALLERQNYRLALLAGRRPGPRLPTLLRRDHAHRPPRRGRGRFDDYPRAPAALGRRRCPRRPARRSSGRPARPDGVLPAAAAATPRAWIVVEKILEPGETLRRDWPVDGTTGLRLPGDLVGLFVDPEAEAASLSAYGAFTGETSALRGRGPRVPRADRPRERSAAKLNRLTALFLEICESHRRHRDYTRHDCTRCSASSPRRCPSTAPTRAEGRRHPERRARSSSAAAATARARARPRSGPPRLPGRHPVAAGRGGRRPSSSCASSSSPARSWRRASRTPPSIATSAWSRSTRSGGDPGRFGSHVDAFHAANAARASDWPATMLTTSTHDTKRSEDVRARIAVLSERRTAGGARSNAGRDASRRSLARARPFDPVVGYLPAQTLVGAWPIDGDRLAAYLLKAAREAKLQTSWAAPERDVRDRPRHVRARHRRRPRLRRRTCSGRQPIVTSWSGQLAGADAAEAHGPGRPRHLPGHGAVGPLPGRSRQPPTRRLRAPRPDAGRARGCHRGRSAARTGSGDALAAVDAGFPSSGSCARPWTCVGSAPSRSGRAPPTDPCESRAPRRRTWSPSCVVTTW